METKTYLIDPMRVQVFESVADAGVLQVLTQHRVCQHPVNHLCRVSIKAVVGLWELEWERVGGIYSEGRAESKMGKGRRNSGFLLFQG